MVTKEKIVQIEIAEGKTENSVSFSPIAGRVIGLVVYHNKDEKFFANLSVKADDGQYISNPQHIANYRSRNTCYFNGCKPVDFQTEGRTFYVEITCDTPVADGALKAQLILIYEDERFKEKCSE